MYLLARFVGHRSYKSGDVIPYLACLFWLATLLNVTLLRGCFSRFWNCTNGTKSRNASRLIFTRWCNSIKLFIPSGYELRWSLAAFTEVFPVFINIFMEMMPVWAVLMLLLLFLVDWFGVVFTMFVFSSGQIVEGVQSYQ